MVQFSCTFRAGEDSVIYELQHVESDLTVLSVNGVPTKTTEETPADGIGILVTVAFEFEATTNSWGLYRCRAFDRFSDIYSGTATLTSEFKLYIPLHTQCSVPMVLV